MTSNEPASLPIAEFAFPGPLRDQLVAAILSGAKTATTSLRAEYVDEPLPTVGARSLVVDSDGVGAAVIEVTGVRIATLSEVDIDHAVDEGEGYASVAEWRAGHEEFWHSAEMRSAMGDPDFTVDDTTLLVLERFSLVTDLR